MGATTLAIPLVPGTAVAATPEQVDGAKGSVTHRLDSHRTRGERVVHAAAEQYGKPYQWGGSGPATFDCSGLTQYVYRQFGVNLPHNSAAQYQVVDHVAKSDMRKGDLVFVYDSGGIHHVGIYAGGNEMWAAPKTGDIVHRQEIWTDRFVVGRP